MSTTASIYINKIKVDYPQAGKDNDSQGFRDNFTNIRNAFSATNADLDLLNSQVVSKVSESSDFSYNVIKKATFQSCTTKILDTTGNTLSGYIDVDYRDGSYQKFKIPAGDSIFTVNNWPDSNLATVTVSVQPTTSTTATISFGGNIVEVGAISLPITNTTTNVKFFDLWSDDSGVTIYVSGKGL